MTEAVKIAVASDLHLGITSESSLRALARRIASESPDLLVLGGDLGEGPEAFRRCLGIFAAVCPRRGVVVGNHDLWAASEASSRELWRELLPRLAREAGYQWLDDGSVRLGRLVVAGSVAWYDYSAGDPAYPRAPAQYRALKSELNGDARFMDTDWDDRGFARVVGARLVERLTQHEADPEIDDVVVVTHVPLLDEQVLRIPGDARWGISNAYYGHLTLGDDVLAFDKVRAIVSGHTHRGREGTRSRGGKSSVRWWVVGSEYHHPRHVTLFV